MVIILPSFLILCSSPLWRNILPLAGEGYTLSFLITNPRNRSSCSKDVKRSYAFSSGLHAGVVNKNKVVNKNIIPLAASPTPVPLTNHPFMDIPDPHAIYNPLDLPI